MSDTNTPYLNLDQPLVGGSSSTWGNKWNNNATLIDQNASTVNASLTSLTNRVAALEAGNKQEAIGTIKPWPSNTAWPPGFLLCDGTIYAAGTYPGLFAVLGGLWGGNGSSTFAVPDFRGRVPVGVDAGTGRLQGQYGADVPGSGGGAATVTLSTAQMPAHAHGGATDGQGQHQHGFNHTHLVATPGLAGGANWNIADEVQLDQGAGFHAHNIATDTQGGNAAHTNCQPGALVWWIIKAVLV